MGPAIRVAGLSVSFGERMALGGVGLEIPPGQFLALTGPNGSGKTTLLRSLLGLVEARAGRVEILGDVVGSLSPRARARRMAWVPQDEPLRDDVPLLRYVLYGRYAQRSRWEGDPAQDVALARRILTELDLADREGDGVASISGGERQRAILARALAQEARILLLDEPTSHLDIGHQLDLLERTRAMARRDGVTVVAALHDLNLAARFADRIVVLSHGRIVADGPPESVLSEDLLAQVWGIDARRILDPRTHASYLIPVRLIAGPPAVAAGGQPGPVHVIGGGGTGSGLLRLLVERGHRVTAGALHLFDSDTDTAEALGVPAVVELPFAPLGPEVRRRHRELLAAARVVVVAPFPTGPGNVANLEDLLAQSPRPGIVLVEPPGAPSLDFVGGQATALRAALRQAGARSVAGDREALGEIEELLSMPRATGLGASDGP